LLISELFFHKKIYFAITEIAALHPGFQPERGVGQFFPGAAFLRGARRIGRPSGICEQQEDRAAQPFTVHDVSPVSPSVRMRNCSDERACDIKRCRIAAANIAWRPTRNGAGFAYTSAMDRRLFLRRSGAVSMALAATTSFALLSGCAPAARVRPGAKRDYAAPDISFTGSARGLPPVRVAPEREIRTVVGLRPFRPSGFVVRVERLGDTLVVHNYGHGGAGITLSWGTSKLAVDMGAPGHRGPAAVLGCGAVGLANARLLQEAGFDVTIYTKALPPETTSNIAGGHWFPAFLSDPDKRTDAFNAQLLAAANYAYRRYQIMVGPHFGVRWMRNYYLSHHEFNENGYAGEHSALRVMMPEYRKLAPDEHPFSDYEFVRQFDTLIIEPPVYLAAMLDEFRISGGRIVVGEVADRVAIQALPEKLVFNCTGLGAKALFDDDELTPIKGQLTILLPQPEVQYAVIAGDLYMFPRSDGIVLGGTHEEGAWSLEPNLERKGQILAQQKALFDSFRS
jgi:D-amino-acid oxidase